jgi:hypothetical protein
MPKTTSDLRQRRHDIDVWVQTSNDGGTNWTDIANFHWAPSGSRLLFNLSSATPVTTQYTPTDGTLTANACRDGLLGKCTARQVPVDRDLRGQHQRPHRPTASP